MGGEGKEGGGDGRGREDVKEGEQKEIAYRG
jgi:hypothetical protein